MVETLFENAGIRTHTIRLLNRCPLPAEVQHCSRQDIAWVLSGNALQGNCKSMHAWTALLFQKLQEPPDLASLNAVEQAVPENWLYTALHLSTGSQKSIGMWWFLNFASMYNNNLLHPSIARWLSEQIYRKWFNSLFVYMYMEGMCSIAKWCWVCGSRAAASRTVSDAILERVFNHLVKCLLTCLACCCKDAYHSCVQQ